jgi:hypothetical protein
MDKELKETRSLVSSQIGVAIRNNKKKPNRNSGAE